MFNFVNDALPRTGSGSDRNLPRALTKRDTIMLGFPQFFSMIRSLPLAVLTRSLPLQVLTRANASYGGDGGDD